MITEPDSHSRFAHMGPPPKTTVVYTGLASLNGQQATATPAAPEGVAVRFRLPARFPLLPARILTALGEPRPKDPSAALARLVEDRARSLPIPDGCLVMPADHAALECCIPPLVSLVVITKSSGLVWLRSKLPRFDRLTRIPAIALWLPPKAARAIEELTS
ncbi:MAG: hypothetical protein ACO4AL_09350 [Steroidobacteraceae bacterium]|jgi:hypothetical protein